MTPPRRVDTIHVTVITGQRGTDGPVQIRVNGVEIGLHRTSGGTDAHETYEGEFFLACQVRTCELLGPETGTWDVRAVEVEYIDLDQRTSIVKLGGATLDRNRALDILGQVAGGAGGFDV